MSIHEWIERKTGIVTLARIREINAENDAQWRSECEAAEKAGEPPPFPPNRIMEQGTPAIALVALPTLALFMLWMAFAWFHALYVAFAH